VLNSTKPRGTIAAGALLIFGACRSDFPCGNTISRRLPSPGGARNAVVFERGCGAMTSRAGTGVSILEGRDTTLSPPDKGNVYLNDNHPGPDGTRAPTEVQVEWSSDTVLVVRQLVGAHVVFAVIKRAGVTVKYDTLR